MSSLDDWRSIWCALNPNSWIFYVGKKFTNTKFYTKKNLHFIGFRLVISFLTWTFVFTIVCILRENILFSDFMLIFIKNRPCSWVLKCPLIEECAVARIIYNATLFITNWNGQEEDFLRMKVSDPPRTCIFRSFQLVVLTFFKELEISQAAKLVLNFMWMKW